MTADLFDAINQNTRATGQWGKNKAPKIPSYPRPQPKKKAPDKKAKKLRSVAEIYKHFQRR
ncbi:hypothetical protein EDD96_2309 [Streptomyces sp. Ag109_G2-6]|uniref:hypothetical protein n=1 Tax=Streptomyces sp. Ag109_G2-6 TaxID=2485154 RepID=UPI000F9A5733|nr:hypothetical protein [Streptomyces sp. Ag109_G2-6]RPF45745.1 hypothetical protein EDD96_2309 [Streptomyces sp. Ag109_G2-6]